MVRGSRRRTGLLAVMGAVNWDTTLFEERFAEPGEEVRVLRIEEGPGGKGANVAAAAARLLGGGKVAFIGSLGDDPLGVKLRESLRREGVDDGGLVIQGGTASGHAFIVVDPAGRKIIHTHFGANEELRPGDLKSVGIRGTLSDAGVLVIMDVPGEAAQAAAAAASADVRTIYSPGVRSSAGAGALSGILGSAHSLVGNEGEILRLSGRTRLSEALEWVRDAYPRLVVVVTRGRSGCTISLGGEVSEIPPFDLGWVGAKPVNSTGSGDAFLAAYATRLLEGAPPTEAAEWGNVAGALKSARSETRGGPDRPELEKAMAVYALRYPAR